MTQKYLICLLLQRAIYALILTFCILYRPLVLTFPYLLLLLYLPFVPVATSKTIRRHTGYYFQISTAVIVLMFFVQISFQFVLATLDEQILSTCNFLEIHLGIVKFNGMPILLILEWFLPDIILTVATPAIYLILRYLTTNASHDRHDAESSEDNIEINPLSTDNRELLKGIGIFLSLFSLLLTSVIQPSILGAIYFITFLGAATWWAFYKELDRRFAIVCRVVMVFLAFHIIALLAYQTQVTQKYFTDNNMSIRYLGFTSLYAFPNCTITKNDVRDFYFNRNARLEAFLNPVAIIVCYMTLTISSDIILDKKINSKNERIDMFSRLRTRNTNSNRKKWNSAANKILKKRNVNDNAFRMFTSEEENEEVTKGSDITMREQTVLGFIHLGEFLCKNSYILTNIVMMVWSIVYHSWITFLFLLWTNILFVIPNQRKNTHRCSPFVVFYAELLLLAQYLYGMNLTEAELPSAINNINLSQIGFIRYDVPCLPLLLKTLFTLTFWITLRQATYECTQTHVESLAPADSTEDDKKTKFIVAAGNVLLSTFLQLWTWIVVFVLFLCAIYGEKITAFRIVYMSLVLVFLATFQLSFRFWRKILYSFWMVVIGFSMLSLILTYSYQFDKFNEYWLQYFKIPYELQTDIGLRKFETKDLFLNLFYPTFVVIITVIQIQIVHQNYWKALDTSILQRDTDDQTKNPPFTDDYKKANSSSTEESTSIKRRNIKMKDLKSITFTQVNNLYYQPHAKVVHYMSIYPLRKWSITWWPVFGLFFIHFHVEFNFRTGQITECFILLYRKAEELLAFVWLFSEMHSTSAILFVAFSLGIMEVSVLHLLPTLMTLIAATLPKHTQLILTRCISLTMGILLILKMIYQIDYINQNEWNAVHCSDNATVQSNVTINNVTANDSNWFGFYKITGTDLILEGYIGYILITTIHAMILMRQQRKRLLSGKSVTVPKLLFPEVARQDADSNLKQMMKYLANYIFYKFGIEITLVMLVVLIGARMDIVAVIYSVWLCVLFACKREKQKKIWSLFQWSVFSLILVQYVAIVGIPPSFCIVLPWNTAILKHLQEWAMLPHSQLRMQSHKLILEFILLMCASKQMHVFRLESRYENKNLEFSGGSNKSIIEDFSNMTTRPLSQSHDYVSFAKTWLDWLKCAVFLGFFWMTLAAVFLAGTSRINVFSLGYLIGSFIFLWQGTDFYLRPIHIIILYWRYLIGYNIFVISTKALLALLQIQTCIFTHEMKSLCWLNQFFGVSCIGQFNKIPSDSACKVPSEGIGLAWDEICFTFLLLQLRIFQSHYFCYVIVETKASKLLASRGAELIDELRRQQLQLQMKSEEEILLKIKQKMDRIKANHQKQPLIDDSVSPQTRTPSVSATAAYRTFNKDEVVTSKLSVSVLNVRNSLSPASLGAYLDKQNLAYASRTGSDYAMRRGPSTEESYPVSPLPTDYSEQIHSHQSTGVRRSNGRQTSINTVSWTDQADSRPLSINLDPSDISYIEKRKLGNDLQQNGFDRQQNEQDTMQHNVTMPRHPSAQRCRPHSLELSGQFNFRDSLHLSDTDRSMLSHQQSILSGDYPLFDDVAEKLDLNLLHERANVTLNDDDVVLNQHISSKVTLKRVLNSLNYRNESKTHESLATLTNSDGELSNPITGEDEDSFPATIMSTLRGFVVSISLQLNKMSRNYRFVTKVLSQEKRELKAAKDFGPHYNLPADKVTASFASTLKTGSINFTSEIKEYYPPIQMQSLLTGLITALWYAFISNTDLVCYSLVFVNMIASASVLTLPIPFMVLLWGTLTIPRPSIRFWVTLIAYTQTVVFVKCLCQFEMFWWNTQPIASNNPLALLRIVGLDKKSNSSTYDLTLLMMLFFHRFMLKQMGIWQFKSENNEPKHRKSEPNGYCLPAESVLQSSNEKMETPADNTSKFNCLPKLAFVSERVKGYCSCFPKFFNKLLTQSNSVKTDVYVHIFLCDFTNFFVLFFGYTAFGSSQGDEGVASYVEENKIPVAFLVMLLLQFVFIIVDRALYLQKNLIGKIVFQFVSVIGMHIWLFFLVPALSERSFNANAAPVAYYVLKCCYFLLSAYQIRCGFPKRILGNCLTKGFSIFNLGAFKVYMMTPFLFELRALMDWMWTDTTMPLFEWLKMEDIFANVYELKCTREMEKDFPATRGVAKRLLTKHLLGGGFLLVVIALIWGPLALFALGNTVGEANIPWQISLELKIGPYEPIYRMSSQSSQIHQLTLTDYDRVLGVFRNDRLALTFLSNYESEDVAAVHLGTNSTALWIISPPDLERLIDDLQQNVTLKVQNKYSLSRKTYNENMLGTVTMETSYQIEESDSGIRESLVNILTNNSSERLMLLGLFPKFLKVINIGSELKTIPQLTPGKNETYLRDISLRMHTSASGCSNVWWEVLENCTDEMYSNWFSLLPYADCDNNLVLYTFSDKLFPETLSIFTAGGVIGIYTTFVFVASRIFRSMFSGGSTNIMFSELPYVDRILQLCLDIYLVRESLEFSLEEDLFSKLIFLYRSPETMIKWTRPANEQFNDDDTDYSQNKAAVGIGMRKNN